jgi:hypothetical protein
MYGQFVGPANLCYEYCRYLDRLLGYLEDFGARSNPLIDWQSIKAECISKVDATLEEALSSQNETCEASDDDITSLFCIPCKYDV